MLNDRRRIFHRRLILIYCGVALAGYVTGFFWPLMVVVLASHLVYSQWQMHRLINWLRNFESGEPPRAWGAWGDVLDYLWSFRRQQRTDLRRLENNLHRVQRSVQNLSDGLVIITRRGEIQWWNDAARGMLDFQGNDVGQALTNLVRDPKFVDWFQRNQEHTQYVYVHPKSGKHLQFINNRHSAGNRLLMVRDITRLKKLEQMRQDFVANASHELRTPLTVLQGYLESFADQSGALPERSRRAVSQMQSQTRRMANLVNDLLLLTRLDSIEAMQAPEAVDVPALLESIADDARELSGDKHQSISVECTSERQLLGISSELRSAFSNLVFNAVHYTPPEGQIALRWSMTDTGACFSVQDNGSGIEQKHIPRLTERFYRVDPSRSSETGGTGLGLAIVKHALAHHDGQLDIASRLGEGSTFTCWFPASRLTDVVSETVASDLIGTGR